MKQIGLGLVQYIQDHDEYLPSAISYQLNPSVTFHETNWRIAIYPYVKSAQIYRCPSGRTHPTRTNVNGGTFAPLGIGPLASDYGANGANDQSVNSGPFCGAVSGARTTITPSAGNTSWPAGPIAQSYVDVNGQPYPGLSQYRPLKISTIQYPSQLIGIAETNNGDNSSVVLVAMQPIYYEHPTNVIDKRGLYSGHLATSNYLFMDGHVKALKPQATAVPNDMWDINKQDVPCQQLVDGLSGVPGLIKVAEWYGR